MWLFVPIVQWNHVGDTSTELSLHSLIIHPLFSACCWPKGRTRGPSQSIIPTTLCVACFYWLLVGKAGECYLASEWDWQTNLIARHPCAYIVSGAYLLPPQAHTPAPGRFPLKPIGHLQCSPSKLALHPFTWLLPAPQTAFLFKHRVMKLPTYRLSLASQRAR